MDACGGFQAEGTARTKACGGGTRDQFKEQQGGQCVWREASQGTVVGDGSALTGAWSWRVLPAEVRTLVVTLSEKGRD